jgi:hypothetical protein
MKTEFRLQILKLAPHIRSCNYVTNVWLKDECYWNGYEIRLVVLDVRYLRTDRPIQYVFISCTWFEESEM